MNKFTRIAALGAAITMTFTYAAAQGGDAMAQDATVEPAMAAPAPQPAPSTAEFVAEPIVQPVDPAQVALDEAANAEPELPADAASLTDLVAEMPAHAQLSDDMHCLAGAIYFESKGEPLAGQLAVGRVIVNRAESSRFPNTYCGVVYQRSQFSFVRGGRMPAINKDSAAWRKAKAVARIAHEDLWESPAKGAMFFHAKYVSPGWRLTRVATVHNHIFYR